MIGGETAKFKGTENIGIYSKHYINIAAAQVLFDRRARKTSVNCVIKEIRFICCGFAK